MSVEDGKVTCILFNGGEIQLFVTLEYLQCVLVQLVLLHQLDAPLLLILFIGFTMNFFFKRNVFMFLND